MKKECKTCKNEFEIRKEDLTFYEQVKTAPPLYCPDCRMARRLVWRNERTFYKRPCDMCKKNMVTLYSPDSPYTVYCHECWWSDNWDPKSFAMEYNPTKPFFEQFKDLMKNVPRIGLMAVNNVRSEYTNGSGENKDCYLVFAADYNEDCMYGRLLQRNKFCVDCAFVHESELCYECMDCRSMYNSMFCERCQSSTDLYFCFDMRDSNNCLFCVNGRHLSNAIFNKKVSKEEFLEKKKDIFSSNEKLAEAKKKFEELKKKAIVKYSTQTKCHNVTGNYLHNCHDGVELYDTYDAKNCSYMTDTENPLDSWDCNNYYYKSELCYNVMGAMQISKVKNSAFIFYSNESEYCDNCYNLSSSFGCAGIKKGSYVILNKEYKKEEYYKIKEMIEEQLKETGAIGQFFPPELSPYGYNETLANDYFPLSKEQALQRGFQWQEKTTGTYGKETIKKGDVPETIEGVTEDILKEVLICEECEKNFKITKSELDFYRRMNIPLPHKDFECRHKERMIKRNPRKLWPRSCMCDKTNHLEHVGGKCLNEFKTSYSPERPEIIFCEQCYQQEVS